MGLIKICRINFCVRHVLFHEKTGMQETKDIVPLNWIEKRKNRQLVVDISKKYEGYILNSSILDKNTSQCYSQAVNYILAVDVNMIWRLLQWLCFVLY